MDKSIFLWLYIDLLVILKSYFVASHDTVTYRDAFLNISYIDSHGVFVSASGHGRYGSGGPFQSASGFLVSVENQDWCHPFPSKPIKGKWIALIPRGHCRFQIKIATAKAMNASGVIIYNYRHRSDDFVMLTSNENNLVSISVSHELGTTLVSLYNAEREVQVGISVTSSVKRDPLVGRIEIMRLCFPILSIMLLLSAVVVLHKYKIRRKKRKECEHKLSNLVTKVFTGSDEDDTCTICLDEYREGQTLRVLHCRHRFHKGCVDPWILEKETCPICKRNLSQGDAEEGNAGGKPCAAVPNVAYEGSPSDN